MWKLLSLWRGISRRIHLSVLKPLAVCLFLCVCLAPISSISIYTHTRTVCLMNKLTHHASSWLNYSLNTSTMMIFSPTTATQYFYHLSIFTIAYYLLRHQVSQVTSARMKNKIHTSKREKHYQVN